MFSEKTSSIVRPTTCQRLLRDIGRRGSIVNNARVRVSIWRVLPVKSRRMSGGNVSGLDRVEIVIGLYFGVSRDEDCSFALCI